ncbi:MAG TPA: undecaprenyl-diphosphatase UppP [Syntrophomonadaceae bacterium]|nr:undecaprenyl-diphosphatase UppP [Syntrophomonadaceae bacterium]
MTLWHAIVLGIVQGLGEFLPISSSAHLILVPWLFKWPDPGLTFDIALHFGTLIAVVLYFWKDWWKLLVGGLTNRHTVEGRLFWYLVAATIPGAAAGFLLENKAETVFRAPILIGIMLIIMGLILYWADRSSFKMTELGDVSFGTTLAIGVSQALAIIPGVSRSGITMSTGLLAGLTRESAARFSFLLSTPIILGAVLVKVPKLLANPAMVDLNFIVGVVVSFITGLVSIGFLLRYVQTRNFLPFAWYRFILGAVVIIMALIR